MIKIIKNESDYEAALLQLSDLMDKKIIPGSSEENALELLLLVLKDYEQKNIESIELDPIEAIKFRMDQMNLSKKELVPFIGSLSKVSEILSGKRTLSLSMIRKLHKGLKIPLESLLRQNQAKKLSDPIELDYKLFPLKEMQERGCFGKTKKSINEIKDYAEELVKDFCGDYLNLFEQNLVFHRAPLHQRGKRSIDKYALSIWQICVLKQLEKKVHLPRYKKELINESWLRKLARLSINEDGPKLVRDYLEQYGIAFVIESQFKKTFLDGAAMLFKGRPVIALTLRHKRIDNFWFVLAHEIAHLIKHINKVTDNNMTVYIDDLDVQDQLDAIELEADATANEALIPKIEWEKSKICNTQSEDKIRAFAQKIGVHPAIVAGRIRHEKNNYRSFSKLVKPTFDMSLLN